MFLLRQPDIRESEITEEKHYLSRRTLLLSATGLALSPLTPASGAILDTPEKPNSWQDITTYNNFYEFGTDKFEPSANAHTLKPRPWFLTIDGEVEKPVRLDLDQILKITPLEERIYRLRCVEGWSMVIPWLGFPLSRLLKQARLTSKARFVEFTTLHDPKQMPGQIEAVLDWPYREGLRIDEAMHPLTLMAVGLYGKWLPNQNGAPLRLVVPWKYGFKSAKSIVRIRLMENAPQSSWMKANPKEYGFFSNVNPEVDHPRWSQASERRIGEIFRRKTLMFNGYGEQVAGLYSGLDLRKYF